MASLREVGFNIKCLLKNTNQTSTDLAKALGFATVDIERLLEGRLSVSPTVLMKIGEYFNVPVSELLESGSTDKYKECVSCMSDFDDINNCYQILDIIDLYIDIREAIK